jgi:hypothetical protein
MNYMNQNASQQYNGQQARGWAVRNQKNNSFVLFFLLRLALRSAK